MDDRIHEGVQTQRAAAFEQFAPFEERVERRAGKGQHQQRDGMTSRALLQCLDRVGGQVVCKEIKDQDNESRPCIDVHGDLKRGVALKECFHDVVEWRTPPLSAVGSIILNEIHAFIQVCYLLGIAVEHQSLAAAELTNAPLACL